MTPLARRFVTPSLALFLVAGIPIWLHAATAWELDDCADPAALLEVQHVPSSRVVQERVDRYGRGRFQWTEGELVHGDHASDVLRFRIVRSFDAFAFYGPPLPYFFGNAFPEDRRELSQVDADGVQLPIHWRHASVGPSLHGYVFVMDGRPVVRPFDGGLASAGRQLLSGRRPITLFVVYGTFARSPAADVEARAEAWLVDAWRRYRSVCRG